MTHIERAIKEAVENGGYKAEQCKKERYLRSRLLKLNSESYSLTKIFLDPLFWQALGKARGWKYDDALIGVHESKMIRLVHERLSEGRLPLWQYHWHRFIDALAEGRSAEEFFRKERE